MPFLAMLIVFGVIFTATEHETAQNQPGPAVKVDVVCYDVATGLQRFDRKTGPGITFVCHEIKLDSSKASTQPYGRWN